MMIDLRSDTVTRPGDGMRSAMAKADVGDDVYGEDPTVAKLEERCAGMLGKEAAVFAPSGTQSNLLGLMSHCGRGDEYIVGQMAHTYRNEGGGAAVLGSIQPQPLDFEPDGTLNLDKVLAVIKPDDIHCARTRLFCLENTQAGKPLPMAYIEAVHDFKNNTGLKTHLDGARIFNAAVRLGVDASLIAKPFDSVSVCLSKGLGAPVGSVLCADKPLIREARKWRKMLGGGMRQAGVLAAAGLYALENNIERLAEDHENAALLKELLEPVDGLRVLPGSGMTNMVFIETSRPGLKDYRKQHGVLISGETRFRLVTHLDVTAAGIRTAADLIREFFSR